MVVERGGNAGGGGEMLMLILLSDKENFESCLWSRDGEGC